MRSVTIHTKWLGCMKKSNPIAKSFEFYVSNHMNVSLLIIYLQLPQQQNGNNEIQVVNVRRKFTSPKSL